MERTRTERLEINPHVCSQLILDKLLKTTQWGKDRLYNKRCWDNWTSPFERMKMGPYLTPDTKLNLERVGNLNIRTKTTKLLGQNKPL